MCIAMRWYQVSEYNKLKLLGEILKKNNHDVKTKLTRIINTKVLCTIVQNKVWNTLCVLPRLEGFY